jgi:polyhydroxyalkanoate synthesis regulator phasin
MVMGLGDLVQKAVYLGIGVASYAGEKAGDKLNELRDQMQKMADEMVERGEMTAEEGKKFVDDMVKKAQQQPGSGGPVKPPAAAPRPIEIMDDESVTTTAAISQPTPDATPNIDIDGMRRQVQDLQDELRRLRKD